LLEAAPSLPKAEKEWYENEAAWLRPGLRFAAVDIAANIVHAAAERQSPAKCRTPLAEALGGPVFYNPLGSGDEPTYTALLPVTVRWHWRVPGAWVHPTSSMLLVPSPGRFLPAEEGPWWVVALSGAERVCPQDRVAAFVALGRERLARAGGER
jgi:hypothetical protein